MFADETRIKFFIWGISQKFWTWKFWTLETLSSSPSSLLGLHGLGFNDVLILTELGFSLRTAIQDKVYEFPKNSSSKPTFKAKIWVFFSFYWICFKALTLFAWSLKQSSSERMFEDTFQIQWHFMSSFIRNTRQSWQRNIK